MSILRRRRNRLRQGAVLAGIGDGWLGSGYVELSLFFSTVCS